MAGTAPSTTIELLLGGGAQDVNIAAQNKAIKAKPVRSDMGCPFHVSPARNSFVRWDAGIEAGVRTFCNSL